MYARLLTAIRSFIPPPPPRSFPITLSSGLVLSLNELVRVEFLPFQPVLDLWIALFGSGTGSSSLCTQFWRVSHSFLI